MVFFAVHDKVGSTIDHATLCVVFCILGISDDYAAGCCMVLWIWVAGVLCWCRVEYSVIIES